MRLNVGESVFDGRDLFSVLVGNFDAESLFQGHNEFHGIQRIRSQIVDKGRCGCDFRFVHAQLLHDNLLNLLFCRRSHSNLLKLCGPASGKLVIIGVR